MRIQKPFILGLGVAILLIVAVLSIVNFSAIEVDLYQVKKGNIQQTVDETGLVQASHSLSVYTTENGQVEKVFVQVGDRVNKGDSLLTLSNHDLHLLKSGYQTSLIQANGNLNLAQAELNSTKLSLKEAANYYNRLDKLYNSGAVSQQEWEKAKGQYDNLNILYEGQLSNMEEALEQVLVSEKALNDIVAKENNLTIISPNDGTIVKLPLKEGQYIMAASEVAEVASLESLEINADILSDDMADIHRGQEVIISAAILKDKTLKGEVIKIYPKAEERLSALGVVQYRVPVVIGLNESDKLKPGYEVKVSIKTLARNEVIIIPREAIIYGENDYKEVMLVDSKGRVTYVEVETGLGDRTNIEVVSGLKVGQKIILDGSSLLKSATKVRQ
ncbi:MAG TPA: efflux RND transporter periplasmic adaptor subunit [Syntrophomonadaceae bacterium]|nr:efflux RND transporter periplasmic adaptor subunit [Syntrophomonadaceae bacterium]